MASAGVQLNGAKKKRKETDDNSDDGSGGLSGAGGQRRRRDLVSFIVSVLPRGRGGCLQTSASVWTRGRTHSRNNRHTQTGEHPVDRLRMKKYRGASSVSPRGGVPPRGGSGRESQGPRVRGKIGTRG